MKTIKYLLLTLSLTGLLLNLSAQNSSSFNTRTPSGEGNLGAAADTACTAVFSVSPDSLSNYPFYYHFKDLSTGNITSWSWDFGDGKTSSAQNPSHQYDNPGSYNICLTVANQNDPSGCYDQACQQVTTLTYFSLGGLVYAGEYPLNNPVVTGDTGIASLYRIVNDQIVFVEDHYFQDYGYYWFGFLFPGEYLIKAGLTEGSPNYFKYFTTYWSDEISWAKAEFIDISTTSQYEAEIHLSPVQVMASGQGIIRGYVNFEQGGAYSMPPVVQTSVILLDAENKPLTFTHPNAAGYFEFSGLPFDTYKISADATGKPSSTLTVTISQSSPVVEGLNLTVFGSNPNMIPEEFNEGLAFIRIYPNPAIENLTVRLYSGISSPVILKITDIAGKTHFFRSENLEKGFIEYNLPVGGLPQGIYILAIQPQGNYLPVTAKFIK